MRIFGSILLWSKCEQILTYNGVHSTVSVTVVPSKTYLAKRNQENAAKYTILHRKRKALYAVFYTLSPTLYDGLFIYIRRVLFENNI